MRPSLARQVVYSVVGAEELDDEDAVATARRGLFAKEALAEGAVAVTLPASLVLTLATSSMPHKSRLDKLARQRPECGARPCRTPPAARRAWRD